MRMFMTILCILLISSYSISQPIDRYVPKSYNLAKGTITVLDIEKACPVTDEHLQKLIELFCDEFGLDKDKLPAISIIYITASTREKLRQASPDKFTGYWYGRYLVPGTIVISEPYSDGTVFHEMVHFIRKHDILFTTMRPELFEEFTQAVEDLMLFTPGYLKYIQAR